MSSREELIRRLDTMELRPRESRQEVIELSERRNRCEECGQFIADDMEICLDCARANEETEQRVDEILYDRSQPL